MNRKRRMVRTCPLCGMPWRHDSESLAQHLRDAHEGDVSALIYHLVRALDRLLNRRPKRK